MGPIPQTALSFSFVLSFAVCRFSRDNPPFPPNLSCAVICLYGGSQAREIAPLEETDLPLASGASVSGRRLCLSFNLKISTASAPAFNCPRFPHPIGSQSVLWKRGALRTFPNEVEEKKKRERKKTHHAVSQSDRQKHRFPRFHSHSSSSPAISDFTFLSSVRLRIFHGARTRSCGDSSGSVGLASLSPSKPARRMCNKKLI